MAGSARSRRSTPRKLDRRGPRVVSHTPDAGANGVRRNANIKVVFNEPMASMTSQAVVLKVAGPAWRMFGLSMAGYNALVSLGLVLVSALAAYGGRK